MDRDYDVIVLLDDEVLAGLVERGVELRKLLQRVQRSFHKEREHGEFEASFFRDLRVLLAERLELGDVGFVVLGDVRDGNPVAMQEPAGKLPDSRERFGFDRAELREIHLWPLRQIQDEPAARSDDGGDRGRSPHHALHELLNVGLRDAAFRARALDPHFLYHARGGRGNFHRCLVRFHADKRLLRLYRIARLDQDFDDVDVLEVADVGYENLSRGSHALCASGVTTGAGDLSPGRPAPSPDQTVTGLGFSGSIRYFLIASETILDLISP